MNHRYPKGYKFEDEKAEWIKCGCGFSHSNREYTPEFWKQWKKPVRKIVYSSGIILVRNNEEVFIVQSYNNCYGLPKGKCEKDENHIEGALREFKEETGSDLEKKLPFVNFVNCEKIFWYNQDKKIEHTFLIVPVKQWFDIETVPEINEITSIGWCRLDNLNSVKLSKDSKEILKQYKMYKKCNSYEEFVNTRARIEDKLFKKLH